MVLCPIVQSFAVYFSEPNVGQDGYFYQNCVWLVVTDSRQPLCSLDVLKLH